MAGLLINDWPFLIKKSLIILIFSIITAALFNHFRENSLDWAWTPPPSTAPIIEDFDYMLAALEDPDTIVIDARDDFFYSIGHLPGAVSLPLAESDSLLPGWLENVPTGASIIIYCSDPLCPMAEKLAEKMMSHGLRPSVFKPGYEPWAENGLAVEAGS